jgi:glucose-1-phosphate adenylyltransferase
VVDIERTPFVVFACEAANERPVSSVAKRIGEAASARTRLSVLSEKRAKPSVPFAGKFRIIDFTLSNCVNSGIFDVAVLTQYRPHSLNAHIGNGKPWDLDRSQGGVQLLQPYQGRRDESWYKGTADAVYQNLNYIRERRADLAVVLKPTVSVL